MPKRTGFSTDPNLVALLVEPLYGKEPGVGVRELMQNAVDAVCELDVWCKAHGKLIESLDLPEQDGDVLIDFIKRDDGSWFLRVQDRGIGMTSDTIQNYFLRAGASFRQSTEWAKEFLDENGKPRVTRAGRFGIGVFAVFLLGQSFRLKTRHVTADKSNGYMVGASANSQLIEIRRDETLKIGTTIEVDLSHEAVKTLQLEKENHEYSDYEGGLQYKIDWFCWDWPKIVKRVIQGPKIELLEQEYFCPVRKGLTPPQWSVIEPKDFDAIYWTFDDAPKLSCNGLRIVSPSGLVRPVFVSLTDVDFVWPKNSQLEPPCIAVRDSAANLHLTTQRYELSEKAVPFIDELGWDMTLSFIAHALVCGPTSLTESLSGGWASP